MSQMSRTRPKQRPTQSTAKTEWSTRSGFERRPKSSPRHKGGGATGAAEEIWFETRIPPPPQLGPSMNVLLPRQDLLTDFYLKLNTHTHTYHTHTHTQTTRAHTDTHPVPWDPTVTHPRTSMPSAHPTMVRVASLRGPFLVFPFIFRTF